MQNSTSNSKPALFIIGAMIIVAIGVGVWWALQSRQAAVTPIEFTSENGFHDFVLDEFNVHTKQVSTGETNTVSFTPDKTGTFEFYCSVRNHRAMGMVGKLIVE